jgi:hypothetical protein
MEAAAAYRGRLTWTKVQFRAALLFAIVEAWRVSAMRHRAISDTGFFAPLLAGSLCLVLFGMSPY